MEKMSKVVFGKKRVSRRKKVAPSEGLTKREGKRKKIGKRFTIHLYGRGGNMAGGASVQLYGIRLCWVFGKRVSPSIPSRGFGLKKQRTGEAHKKHTEEIKTQVFQQKGKKRGRSRIVGKIAKTAMGKK